MLLMIPGPIEISARVRDAYCVAPPSHLAPHVVEAFGRAIEQMREVWMAPSTSQPFIISGSGTLAMEIAVTNLIEAGDHVLVINTGYFSDRMVTMLERRGANITQVSADLCDAPGEEEIAATLANGSFKALFATHVDTSTGVLTDAKMLSRLASEHGALSIFDGVCATAGEAFDMGGWGADIYLTGSQKAIGLPPGLALLVVSERAMRARDAISQLPPMSLDLMEWLPIMRAYEARANSYFATPATPMILALDHALAEILECTFDGGSGVTARIAQHRRAARAMRAAWAAMNLELLPVEESLAAHTLSAIKYPEGVDASLVGLIKARGVVVAGGLHPELKTTYFRVGHMGAVLDDTGALHATIEAIEGALIEAGHALEAGAARRAFDELWSDSAS